MPEYDEQGRYTGMSGPPLFWLAAIAVILAIPGGDIIVRMARRGAWGFIGVVGAMLMLFVAWLVAFCRDWQREATRSRKKMARYYAAQTNAEKLTALCDEE